MTNLLSLHVKNRTSEIRDILMAERTTLSWIKFCSVLSLSAMAVCFRTDDSFGRAMGLIFACLSLFTLVLALFNYLRSIYSYRAQKTEVTSSGLTDTYLSLVILALLGINIGLMAKGSETTLAI
ncbi:uncharacterized protein OGAPODRAFT_93767 [Ogataea polymorpha]|uniref:uncharacterized protein n=1 Tax=Ogataea polymorpha TaxID=460523 RepID=UPI0007F46B5E|nr:uncharacterized protein OGAPODRAFT_93767 [Ogataea polymorpha]OBA16828.1 hypothetical protein OGAPODRAFT_93767 [Ogataea polymorpha]